MSASITRPPAIFWIVALLLTLWQLLGCAAYLAEAYAGPGLGTTPPWVTALFAISVWVGLAAAIAMLLRRRISTALFLLSLIAVVIRTIYFVVNGVIAQQTVFDQILGAAIIVIGVFAVWYTKRAADHHWTR